MWPIRSIHPTFRWHTKVNSADYRGRWMWYLKDRKSVKLPALVRLQSFTVDDVKWLPRSRLEFCLVDGVSWTVLHGLALYAYSRTAGQPQHPTAAAAATMSNLITKYRLFTTNTMTMKGKIYKIVVLSKPLSGEVVKTEHKLYRNRVLRKIKCIQNEVHFI